MIIRTNQGDVVGDLIRQNKKTVVVRLINTKEVKTETKNENGDVVETKTDLVKETRYVKRRLKDVVAF